MSECDILTYTVGADIKVPYLRPFAGQVCAEGGAQSQHASRAAQEANGCCNANGDACAQARPAPAGLGDDLGGHGRRLARQGGRLVQLCMEVASMSVTCVL